ncbi:MAG: cohesin domain-containing protein [Candidatus Kryptoniota bacterium]
MKDYWKRKMGWVMVILIGLVVPGFIAQAQSQPLLKIDPSQMGLKPGDQAAFTLQVFGVQDFYGVEVHLQYDAQIIEILDSDPSKEGVQCKSGDIFDQGFIAQNTATNGRIDFAATLLNPAPPFHGDGQLLECLMRGKNMGSSPITITNAILANRNGEAIAASNQAGYIEVSESGKVSSPSAQSQTKPENTTQTKPERRMTLKGDWLLYLAAGAGLLLFLIALILAVRTSRRQTKSK